MAYEAKNRHKDCIELYRQLEKTHPIGSIRRQAKELRYILQAPKLKISQEEMVTIPLIGSSYDRWINRHSIWIYQIELVQWLILQPKMFSYIKEIWFALRGANDLFLLLLVMVQFESLILVPVTGVELIEGHSLVCSYAGTWTDKNKDKQQSASYTTTNQVPSSRDFIGDFMVWRPPVGLGKSGAFWAALTLWMGLVVTALILQRWRKDANIVVVYNVYCTL